LTELKKIRPLLFEEKDEEADQNKDGKYKE